MLGKRARTVISALAMPAIAAACTVSPEPFGTEHHIQRAAVDLDVIRKDEFVPTRPITLHEAMARAIVSNLKRRVSQIESRIAETELERSNYDMLPALELNADRKRSNLRVSPSEDRISNTANATFVWNFLDLGVSYARAKQRADEVLISKERERKALQDIIRQVNAAFWRAATSERLMKRVRGLATDLQVAIRESRYMERTGTADLLTTVAFRREVVEAVRQSLSVQRELSEARAELAELLNIRPGTDFELAVPAQSVRALAVPMPLRQMETYALQMRPELRIEDYNERISEWQAREAFHNMLPGLKVDVGRNYSSDSTNLTPNWLSTGMHLGMNLFNLFSGSSEMELAERKGELARQQRLAMSLAVLTQLHMAYIKFNSASQQMRLAREIAESDRQLIRLVRTDGDMLKHDFFDAVRIATQQLRSEMDEQFAYVDLATAHAELMHATGMDSFPDKIPLDDVAALTEGIRKITARWVSPTQRIEQPAESQIDRLVNAMVTESAPADTTLVAARSPAPGEPEPRPSGGQAGVSAGLVARLNMIAPAARGPAPAKSTDRDDWILLPAPGAREPRPSAEEMADSAALVARLNRIAPAARGPASVKSTDRHDWTLFPAPGEPESRPSGGKAGVSAALVARLNRIAPTARGPATATATATAKGTNRREWILFPRQASMTDWELSLNQALYPDLSAMRRGARATGDGLIADPSGGRVEAGAMARPFDGTGEFEFGIAN